MDPINHTAGAGFAAWDTTKSIRVTDNASSLQLAIMGALTHASLKNGHVILLRLDQPLTVYSIPQDNTLLTTVLTIAQRILNQGRRIIINGVPSHIGIQGNELADRLAKGE